MSHHLAQSVTKITVIFTIVFCCFKNYQRILNPNPLTQLFYFAYLNYWQIVFIYTAYQFKTRYFCLAFSSDKPVPPGMALYQDFLEHKKYPIATKCNGAFYLELIPGFEPGTSSLPRMCSADWAILANSWRLFIISHHNDFVKENLRILKEIHRDRFINVQCIPIIKQTALLCGL